MKVKEFRRKSFRDTVISIMNNKIHDYYKCYNYIFHDEIKFNFNRKGETKVLRINNVFIYDCIAYCILVDNKTGEYFEYLMTYYDVVIHDRKLKLKNLEINQIKSSMNI